LGRGVPVPGSLGYISFSQSTAPDNRTIYASIGNRATSPRFLGLFKTTDAGRTWRRMPAGDQACMDPDLMGAQCSAGYTQTIGVAPQAPRRVYIGFQQFWLSTDGGLTAKPISRFKIHWDHHVLRFSPRAHWRGPAPTPFWAGTDGGIHRSADGGNTFANLNNTIATNLFIGIGMSLKDRDRVETRFSYGGTHGSRPLQHR